ncbi:transglycosylase domain-containing protein [Marinilabilia salmonicolor]|jgi:penicillin-binding protein 1A|uniref:Penicillin-binding protein 1A n=1 Tax=Marinilabilia salmonicolor TaxID=989 RepID=A0A2T0WXI4_9BACT|nr:transglycosylase domain-containing protein [Marinilabilia salmonicolor]PRY91410.1 penicillin-binding protein 1A [Marinilabilia salmonicolor]RCW37500.1 penicillin-binding protein 1A [Marinilabilia salmonicolor]
MAQGGLKKTLRWLYGLFIGAVVFVVLLFFLISKGALGFMPSFEELENPKSNLATILYSSDQEVLGKFFHENRTNVNYNDLNPNVINALIATEDIRFYKHSGIDSRGLARVLFRTILMGEKSSGGGSTITQQLAKLLFHDPASNLWQRSLQKLKEWVIAVKLERSYTKPEILTMYLNKAPFIYGAYGIESAAHTFFSKPMDSIRVEEAATLIGMLQNPSLYNPLRRPDITQNRRNIVLSQMQKASHITPEEFDSLKTLPLNIRFQRDDHIHGLAPYFREHLRLKLSAEKPERENYASWQEQQFIEDSIAWLEDPLFGWTNKNLKADGTKYNIYSDGLKIYTTIDSRLQTYAENAVKQHIGEEIQPLFFKEKEGRSRAPFTSKITQEQYENIIDRAMRNSDRYRNLKNAGFSTDSIRQAFEEPVEMEVFSWQGNIDTVMSPLDSIHYYKSFLRASLLSMDPQSGHVKAYIGGPNYQHFKYDMVSQGKRQVGSTIKPFVYTLAMQEGLTPCDMVPNIPQTFNLITGQTWTPRNSGSSRAGEMVSLKWGLANSNNNITAWILKQFNPQAVVNIIHDLGIQSPMDPVPSIVLGVPEFGLDEMVSGYCTYANKGVNVKPLLVTRIEDRYGNVVANFSPRKEEVLSEETAYLMINLLEGVINQGTGRRLRFRYQFDAQIGGKTGTTQNHSDGWFMGVTPNLVTGVWVGGEDRDIHFDNIGMGQGANTALPIWALYMNKVYEDEEIPITQEDKFEEPVNFNINLDCPDENITADEEALEGGDSIVPEDEFF